MEGAGRLIRRPRVGGGGGEGVVHYAVEGDVGTWVGPKRDFL